MVFCQSGEEARRLLAVPVGKFVQLSILDAGDFLVDVIQQLSAETEIVHRPLAIALFGQFTELVQILRFDMVEHHSVFFGFTDRKL